MTAFQIASIMICWTEKPLTFFVMQHEHIVIVKILSSQTEDVAYIFTVLLISLLLLPSLGSWVYSLCLFLQPLQDVEDDEGMLQNLQTRRQQRKEEVQYGKQYNVCAVVLATKDQKFDLIHAWIWINKVKR